MQIAGKIIIMNQDIFKPIFPSDKRADQREEKMNCLTGLSFRRQPLIMAFSLIAIVIATLISVELLASGPQTSPDLNVEVSSFTPQGEIELETNFTIKFSRDMAPPDSLDKPVLDPPLAFKPAIPGIARWIEKDVLRFYPDNELLPSTRYEAKVVSKNSYLYGNRINEQRTFTFRTPPLKVLSFHWNPLYNPQMPQVQAQITLFFNYKVDIERLKEKLSIKGGENAYKSDVSFQVVEWQSSVTETAPDGTQRQYSSEITIETEPINITDNRQTYKLVIKDGLACHNCGEGLPAMYEGTLTVGAQKRFNVTELRANIRGTKGTVYIYFSTAVKPEPLNEYITVSPPLNVTIISHHTIVELLGDFLPGQTYKISVAEGLTSMGGTKLDEEFSSSVTIPDLRPTLKFISPGLYLPKQGARLVEVETINVKKMSVEVNHIFPNNLVYALASNRNWNEYDDYYQSPLELVGREFFEKTVELSSTLNQPLNTTIDVGSIIGDTSRGIFTVSIRNRDGRWDYDTRIVMLTDIGVIARLSDDYLMVWANSLSETKPIGGATINLLSKNNQVLVSGKTDSRGIAVFSNIGERIKGFVPFLITVSTEKDLSFLRFENCLLPTSDFDVKGRPYLTTGYEAFVYLDRDIFRPGDTAHIVSIVRGANGAVPPEFPYFLTITDPSGREFQSFRVKTEGTAFLTVDFNVPDFARTGKYTITAHIGETQEIGRTGFQVEEFMPDRIKVTVTTPRNEYGKDDTVQIDVTGKFLFGPPAAGHKVSGHVTIEPTAFAPAGYAKYTFSEEDLEFSRMEVDLPDNTLNDSGSFTYIYAIPSAPKLPSALKGLISASVSEQGGRAINAYTEVTIHPYDDYIGIRLNFDGYAKPHERCEASLMAVTKDGEPTALGNVRVNFYRVVYNSILKRDEKGWYRYVSEQSLVLIDSANVDISADGATVGFIPLDYGNYKIVAHDDVGGHTASTSFYASGWGYAPWSMEFPDRINIDLDLKEYSPGQMAKVQIRAPFGGKLLLTIEKDRVLDFITYDMTENTAEINLKIKEEYYPNAYITATVLKKAGEVDKVSPARAFGAAPLMLIKGRRGLTIDITAPEVIRPKTKLAVDISVGTKGVTEMTVAAIDAGILQLTDFGTPDPLDFFYGKKKLHLNPYDIYSLIFPEAARAESHLSAAGDKAMFEMARKRHLNPVKSRRVKPVALWTGIVKTDATGKARVEFAVPEFNGKLIIMAVATQGDKFGSATDEVTVRDKIVLQESFPRFVSPNDVFDGLVTLFNNTGSTANISVQFSFDGPLDILSPATQTISLPNNSEGSVVFKLKGKVKAGNIQCRVTATDGTDQSQLSFEFPNRPALPLITRHGSGAINQGNPATIDLPSDWVETTDQYVIQTSSFDAVAYTKNINYLVGYPYGCLEQTTSRLFPMLYFNDLARFVQPELIGSRGSNYFIQEGIVKLTGMMREDGMFRFWPEGEKANPWSSIYASHFLLEAGNAGFYIDKKVLNKITDNLKDIANGRYKDGVDNSERIYAAYALARTGKLEKKIVNYLKSLYTGDLSVYSKFQLAGALAAIGDRETAMSMIPTEIQPATYEPETGGRFDSGVRTNAILLEILTQIDPGNPSCPVLAKSLMEDAQLGRWYTTQDNAFALMALGKYLKRQPVSDFTGSIKIDGDSSYNITTKDFKIMRGNLAGKKMKISISGSGTCFYYWQASGIPVVNAPEEFVSGISITRIYLDADGKPLDLTSVPVGTQVIAHITAEAVDRDLENVVINDLIPAGFEIENPRLKTTPRLAWVPQMSGSIDYQDIRDDRLLMFVNLYSRNKMNFYYSLRAISAGQFKIPPVAAECMYNPLIAGASSSGVLTVSR